MELAAKWALHPSALPREKNSRLACRARPRNWYQSNRSIAIPLPGQQFGTGHLQPFFPIDVLKSGHEIGPRSLWTASLRHKTGDHSLALSDLNLLALA